MSVLLVCSTHTHTGDSRTHFHLLPAFPWDSSYSSKCEGKFRFLREAFCFGGFLVRKYFQQNFPTQWSFIKNLFENDGIHWPIGTLENVSIFPAVL